jgi:hypothetical protein
MLLVSIETEAENEALVAAVAPLYEDLAQDNGEQPGVWTSATDSEQEGDWRWGVDGPAFWEGDDTGEVVDGAFAAWGPERPNDQEGGGMQQQGEDCAVLYLSDGDEGDAGEWNDLRCYVEYTFVCESP